MNGQSGFHEGERAVQLRAGEQHIAAQNAAMVAGAVRGGARAFISQQAMAGAASIDEHGHVWASLLFGPPGFLHTDDGRTILIDTPAAQRDALDPFWHNVEAQRGVGLLFIELASRRRYRVNGTITDNDQQRLTLAVTEAFPNCPKYIQRRHLRDAGPEHAQKTPGAQGTALTPGVAAILRNADTFFIASIHAGRGPDVSHRGGQAGFISVLADGTLRFPDYPGNSMFNTLGNIHLDGHVGLCVPDFAGNHILQLSGQATIRWDLDDPAGESGGTGRFIDFKPGSWLLHDMPHRLAWEYDEPSPYNPPVNPVGRKF